MVDGKVVNFRGTLTICSADNPAACLLGGYKSLHSAIRKCRTCMAVDDDIQTKVHFTALLKLMYTTIIISSQKLNSNCVQSIHMPTMRLIWKALFMPILRQLMVSLRNRF